MDKLRIRLARESAWCVHDKAKTGTQFSQSPLYSLLNTTTISFLPPLLSSPTRDWFPRMMGALVGKKPQREVCHPTKPPWLSLCPTLAQLLPAPHTHATMTNGPLLEASPAWNSAPFSQPNFSIIPDPMGGSPTPRSLLQLLRSRIFSPGMSYIWAPS